MRKNYYKTGHPYVWECEKIRISFLNKYEASVIENTSEKLSSSAPTKSVLCGAPSAP